MPRNRRDIFNFKIFVRGHCKGATYSRGFTTTIGLEDFRPRTNSPSANGTG